ncbi:MAG: hypothetical protein F9K18_01100 [Thermoanaerobaculia bacterium]|nr:MAG: hypothetical protein F9K18_01100 [Thermoanaerobaculia bacterium]
MPDNPWRVLSGFPDAPDGPSEMHPIALKLRGGLPPPEVYALLEGGEFFRMKEVLDDSGRLELERTMERVPRESIAFWAPLDSYWRSMKDKTESRIVELLRAAEAAAPGWQIPSIVVNHIADSHDSRRLLVGATANTKRVDPRAAPLGGRWDHVNPELCRIYEGFEIRYGRRALDGTFELRRTPDGTIEGVNVSPW